MKRQKKWISIFVLIAFLCTIVPLPVLAAEVEDSVVELQNSAASLFNNSVQMQATTGSVIEGSGMCGDNATWSLSNGVLTISGTGPIRTAPWASMKDSIVSVVIKDGITNIPNSLFANYTSLTTVTIGENVTVIDWSAFYYCTALENIVIPDSVTSIKGYNGLGQGGAFQGCSALKT